MEVSDDRKLKVGFGDWTVKLLLLKIITVYLIAQSTILIWTLLICRVCFYRTFELGIKLLCSHDWCLFLFVFFFFLLSGPEQALLISMHLHLITICNPDLLVLGNFLLYHVNLQKGKWSVIYEWEWGLGSLFFNFIRDFNFSPSLHTLKRMFWFLWVTRAIVIVNKAMFCSFR